MNRKNNKNDMEISYLGTYERRFNGPLPLTIFGHIPHKTDIMDREMSKTVCPCFITEGDGFVEIDGVRQEVQVPFVMLFLAERRFRYGPLTFWTETYLHYTLTAREFFSRWRLPDDLPLIWPLKNLSEACAIIGIMRRLCNKPNLHNSVDLIDRFAETLILLSRHGHSGITLSDEHERILHAESFVRNNFRQDLDINGLAERFFFSRSGFYRHWNAMFNTSPNDLIIDLRLEACRRALIESFDSVKEIAKKSGFDDAGYCTRAFWKKFRLTPKQYRKLNGSLT